MITRKIGGIVLGVILAAALVVQAGCSSSAQSSSAQRVAVSANGVFEPYPVRVEAGIPVVLAFGQGSGCTLEVHIPQFGVAEDLSRGGATVSLPGLEAGTYDLICQSNMVMGQIVAE